MSAPLLPPRSAEVADIMAAAMQVFRATLPKCLPLAMLSILLAQLASLYALATGKSPDLLKPHDATFWVLFIMGFATWQLLAAIIMLRQRSMLAGRPPGLKDEWRAAFQRWPLLFLSAMLSGLVMSLGFVLLIAPGIYAFICFLLLRPVVLFEKVDAAQALHRCFRLVRPRWPKFFAAALIGTLIVVVCTLAAVAAMSLLTSLLGGLGIQAAAINALGAAVLLGVLSVAAVYFSALWLALYSVASSSA
jgi:hypothetical protein